MTIIMMMMTYDDDYGNGYRNGDGGDCEEGRMEIRKRRTKFFQLFALVFCTVWITDRETEKSGAEQRRKLPNASERDERERYGIGHPVALSATECRAVAKPSFSWICPPGRKCSHRVLHPLSCFCRLEHTTASPATPPSLSSLSSFSSSCRWTPPRPRTSRLAPPLLQRPRSCSPPSLPRDPPAHCSYLSRLPDPHQRSPSF